MELTSQILTFLITIVTGMLLGVLFDCYRVLRGAFNPREVMTWFTDLLYWLAATGIVFIALVASNWGELRLYVFMGILSGLAIYYKWMSLLAVRLFSRTIRLIKAILSFLKKAFIIIFLRPSIYCLRIVNWPAKFAYRKVRSWYQSKWPIPPDDEKK